MALSCPTSTTPSAPLFSHPPQTPLHHNQHHHQQQFSFPISKPTGTLHHHQHRSLAAALSGFSGVGKLEIGEQVLGDTLDGVEVFGLDGKGVVISDLWRDRRAVVAFAWHFGCVLCRKRADYLGAKKEQMDASGVALIFIGPGTVEQDYFSYMLRHNDAELLQSVEWMEIYADPNHASYEVLRFISGVSTIFTPKAGLKIIESYMEGYRQDWKLSFEKHTVQRGGWHQGGILVAGPGKCNISYIHRGKEAGDDPPIEDVLKACCT